MGEPSAQPPFPPTAIQGGDQGSKFPIDRVLKDIQECGYNMTLLNRTQIFSMNLTQQLSFLNDLYSRLNCSSGDGHSPWSTPSSPATKYPHIVLVVYFVTVMVLGLLVNICVIGTIYRVRRLRTITNCFVLSLALADLLMAAVVVPLKIKELYETKSKSPFLDTLFPILGVASLLNLCVVTLDRYFTITNPLTYEARINSLQVGMIIASIWIISTVQEMIHFAVSSVEDERLFQVIRFVIVFSIPFICVIFVNTKIYCIARGHARQIRANVPDQNDSSGRSFSRKMKTAQVIALLVGTFMLTWLPYFVVTIYEHFHEDPKVQTHKTNDTSALEIAKVVCACLACSTALFNPLLYGFLRKEVRTGIIRGLKCQNVNQSDFETTAAEITTRRLETTRK